MTYEQPQIREHVPDRGHPDAAADPAVALPDVVIICRPGDSNEELRYALRSLANVPHGQVHIVGGWPSWVTSDVNRISVRSPANKQVSALNNLITACQTNDISDPFYVWNDDMYVLQPIAAIPAWHGGNLDAFIAQHRQGSAYRTAMLKTRDRLVELGEDPAGLVTWDLHTPMLIEKLGMLMAIDLGKGITGMHNRTMYGNLMHLQGEEHDDVKVYIKSRKDAYLDLPLVSTSDRTFKMHPIGRYIRDLLSEPSTYEKEPPTATRTQRQAVRYSYTSVIRHPRRP